MARGQLSATRALTVLRRCLLHRGAFFAALVVLGQLMMDGELSGVVEVHFPKSSRIDSLFLPQMARLDDLLMGLVLLIVGGVGFALTLRTSRFYEVASTGIAAPLRLLARESIWARSLAAASAGMFVYLILRLWDGDYHWSFPLLLGLALGLAATYWLWQDRKSGVKLSLAFTWWEGVGLGAVLVLAYCVLTYRLADVPNTLLGDEGSFFEAANNIAHHGSRPDIFDPGVYSFPVLSNIFQAFFLKTFGASISSWRLSSVIPSVVALIPMYLLARETLGRRIAFMSVFLVIFSPYFLAFSRIGYNNSQSIFPVVASLLFLHLGWQRGSKLYLFLAGVMAGFGFYTFTAAKVVVPIILAYALYLVLTRRLRLSQVALSIAVLATGLILLAAPIIISTNARFPGSNWDKLAETLFVNRFYLEAMFPNVEFDHVVEVGQHELVLDPDYDARLLGRALIRTPLVLSHDDVNRQWYIHSSLAGPVASVFYIFGLAAAVVGFRRNAFANVLIWFLACIFGLAIITTFPARATLMPTIIPALAILTALGVAAVATEVRRRLTFFPQAGGLVAVASLAAIAVVGGHEYFHHASVDYKPDLQFAILWKVEEQPEPPHVVVVHSDPRYDNFTPIELNQFDTGATFERQTAVELLRNGVDDLSNAHLLFFVQSEDDAQVTRYLENTFGETGQVSRATLRDGNTFVIHQIAQRETSARSSRR
jgi:4-amino-4-deoxy-L-arabinose transferase-like glycosyltransferase